MAQDEPRLELPAGGPYSNWGEWAALLIGAIDDSLTDLDAWFDTSKPDVLTSLDEIRWILPQLSSCVAALEGANVALPVGMVGLFANTAIPSGWLACDGAAVSRSIYADLFAAISTTFGAGDGTTTFNLPDLRGRAAIGVGTGSGLTARSLAASGGEETHLLTSSEMPSHDHAVNPPNAYVAGGGLYVATPYTGYSNDHSFSFNTASTGGDGAHNNMSPFLALAMAIYAGG